MSIQKADPNKPYGQTIAPDNTVTTQEYRPLVCFAVSKVYKEADVPVAAAGNASIIIWVVDAVVGNQLRFSNGTQWIPIQV